MEKTAEKLADKGRQTDSVVAHLTPGEMVIPVDVLQAHPELEQAIHEAFTNLDADPLQYVVGHENNSINPETGMPEFGFFHKITHAFKKVLKSPIGKIGLGLALPFAAPALGATLGISSLAAGAGLGAGAGLLSGGGLKGAAIGGLTGGAAGYFGGGGSLGGLFSGAAGEGATATGNGLSYGLADGVSSGATKLASSGSLFGGLSGAGSGTAFSGLSSYAQPASTIFSGLQAESANDKAKKQLLAAQGKAADVLSPYLASGTAANSQLANNLSSGFNPGDLTQDPGYQFDLAQGTKALGAKQAASGSYFSGSALKAAQDYGTGLADKTYGDAYSRYLQNNSQLASLAGSGQQAAGSLADIYSTMGSTKANAAVSGSNILNSTLSQLTNPSAYAGLTPEQIRQYLLLQKGGAYAG